MKTDSITVQRHPPIVRLTHWSVAISGLVLLFSGFGQLPMYKRYKIVDIPGLSWAGDFEITLVMHYVASVVFVAAVLFHILYHLRRREFACLPKRGDVRESWQIIKCMLTRKPEPPHGKYLAEQRLAYLAIGVVALLLIITGMIKTYKNLGPIVLDPTFLEVVTLIHTFAGMVFAFLVVMHVGIFALKSNWPLLGSMFTGRVKLSYAESRHPKWIPPGRPTPASSAVAAEPEPEAEPDAVPESAAPPSESSDGDGDALARPAPESVQARG